ncbi:peptidyl-lys metalloendopeptidase [Rhizoctonia solani 123E]|uniref:Peptidyl-lys metalloendopeptidase n=1 Tax=Rhizoctonia solani 123E TaxID=1423351 RepID=A0A074RNV0_9AGAM|nr:peptidyl-lys metalloendopeptidase [Rhizoctonia solani 123E]
MQADTDAVKRIDSTHQASSSDSSSIPDRSGLRFVGCNTEQMERIKGLTWIANEMIDYARLTLADDSKSELYKTWFGVPDQPFYDTVVGVFNEIIRADKFTYDCETCASQYPRSKYDAYIQLTKFPSRRIYLCETFWNTHPLGIDSQASLVVRSLVQYTGGNEFPNKHVHRVEARRLANKNPTEAIKSFNNYEYFVETYFTIGAGTKVFFDNLKEFKINKKTPAGKFEHTVHRVG